MHLSSPALHARIELAVLNLSAWYFLQSGRPDKPQAGNDIHDGTGGN
jgi:hypothetical protein